MDYKLDVGELFEAMAGHIITVGTDNFEEKGFSGEKIGDHLMRLQILTMKGEQCLQVFGEDSLELAEQLVLACLQNISIEHLGALHLKPLNTPLQVQKENKELSKSKMPDAGAPAGSV